MLNGVAVPASTFVPELSAGFDASLTPYAYDFDLALEFLQLAGFNTDKATFKGFGLMILGLLSLSIVLILKRKK